MAAWIDLPSAWSGVASAVSRALSALTWPCSVACAVLQALHWLLTLSRSTTTIDGGGDRLRRRRGGSDQGGREHGRQQKNFH